MLHPLTEKNIRDGYLSDEDYALTAGHPVKSFGLAEFPYFDELRKNGTLTADQLQTRSSAIFDALRFSELTGPNGPFVREDAEKIAANSFGHVRYYTENVTVRNLSRFCHFGLIANHGFEQAHEADSKIWINHTFSTGKKTKQVFPGLLKEAFFIDKFNRSTAAVVLSSRSINPRSEWAHDAKIQEALTENFPNDNMHVLLGDSHEKRHLQQLKFNTDATVARFYTELDADMASRAALRQANIGKETLNARQHTRYMDMVLTSPEYWFAGTLEDLENKKEPKDFLATYHAVGEIRLRISMHSANIETKHLSSRQVQNDVHLWDTTITDPSQQVLVTDYLFNKIYKDLTNLHANRNPAPMFTAVRQLVDSNVFTDPFSEHLATRIVEAAAYFNPDLIYADREPARRRMNNAMRSSSAAPAP